MNPSQAQFLSSGSEGSREETDEDYDVVKDLHSHHSRLILNSWTSRATNIKNSIRSASHFSFYPSFSNI